MGYIFSNDVKINVKKERTMTKKNLHGILLIKKKFFFILILRY